MWKSLYIFNLLYCIAIADSCTFKSYEGVEATSEEIAEFTEKNIADICTVTFEPCDETEWRRIDGSCNNLKYPSRGMFHTPMWRVLEANYSDGFAPRKTKSGKEFLLARQLRSLLLSIGNTINTELATAASFFTEFSFVDLGSVHDIRYYLTQNTHCCEPEGLDDPMCAPNYIPEDDYLHRFTDIRCFNMTKPLTYQNRGCIANDTTPERINYATTFYDLSNLYVHTAGSTQQNRAYEGGRLKVEVVDGRIFPSDANENTTCFIKEAIETGCTRNVPNGLLGTNLFSTWFWRMHNHIADALAELNPCWDDDMLMYCAMDINVAYYSQILYYEFFALMLGKQNLIDEGILHTDEGFRDPYDETVVPSLALEFAYVLRWFHTTQDAFQRMIDTNGTYVGSRHITDFNLRVQELAADNNMALMTQGICKQAAGAFDFTVHPDIADTGLGRLAKAFDIVTADLSRGAYFGLAPYIQYRDMCTNYTISHETFEDLSYIMDDDKIELLKLGYEDPVDIDMMAGMWTENLMEGTWVPPTVYCILVKHLRRSIVSDRFMYERPNRPHAFNAENLAQIRQASLAGLLCMVGDDVSEIQPHAFQTIGSGNEVVSCDEIPQMDFTSWKDDTCDL